MDMESSHVVMTIAHGPTLPVSTWTQADHLGTSMPEPHELQENVVCNVSVGKHATAHQAQEQERGLRDTRKSVARGAQGKLYGDSYTPCGTPREHATQSRAGT